MIRWWRGLSLGVHSRRRCKLYFDIIRVMVKKILVLLVVFLSVLVGPVHAQVVPPDATMSSEIIESPMPKVDITQPTVEVKSKLEKVLEENPTGPLTWHNFLRHAVASAVAKDVPVNTVVLILLFPLVVAIVAAARHLIGMRGVGILTPALLSVAFLATGVWSGVILFLVILSVATVARIILKHLKLQYLPRLALLLWIVSGSVFLALWGASIFNVAGVVSVGIFPILILMLLAETFIDIQQGRSGKEARDLILETFLLAILTSLLLGWESVQRVVLLYPEIVYFGVGIFDVFMGRYTGLRLSEYLMYRGIVKEDEEE